MRIDSHNHFWKYTPEDYPWMTGELAALRRDFLPEHLKRETSAVGIDGVVAVQGRSSLLETAWLLDLADAHDFIPGVVGWAPLVSPTIREELGKFASRPKLKGLRHIIQEEPDDDYILREDFNAGVGLLREFDLVYDILISERRLPQTLRFVDRHPRQVFVVDHIAKPRIKEAVISPWKENLAELARRPNVFCKLSGVTHEADHKSWNEDEIHPYMEVALEAFGPRRLMFASDWPVCLLSCDYERWHEVVANFISRLSGSEQERIGGGTASEAYKL